METINKSKAWPHTSHGFLSLARNTVELSPGTVRQPLGRPTPEESQEMTKAIAATSNLNSGVIFQSGAGT